MYAHALRILALAWILTLSACGANGEIKTIQDPFNGPQRAFARYLDFGHYTAVGMAEGGGKYSVQVLVVMPGQAHNVGHAGDKGLFKLGAETFTLDAGGDAKPVTGVNQTQIFTQWMVVFNVSRDELLKFAQAPLSAVKVAIGDITLQLAVSPDDAALIQRNARTLAGTTPPQ